MHIETIIGPIFLFKYFSYLISHIVYYTVFLFFVNIIYILMVYIFQILSKFLSLATISPNVPAVYEVGGGIQGLAKQDRRRQFAGTRRGSL